MKTNKLKVGDVVIGNEKAKDYLITTEGSIGVVKKIISKDTIKIALRYSTYKDPIVNKKRWEGQEFPVLADAFDIYKPEIEKGDLVRVFCGEKTVKNYKLDSDGVMKKMEKSKKPYIVQFVIGDKIGVSADVTGAVLPIPGLNLFWFDVEDVIKVEKPKYRRPRVEEKPTEAKAKPMAKVRFCGKKTTVSFPDSFYSVECKKGDTYDPEKGVLLCIAKYAGYSYGDIEKMIKQAEYDKEDFAIGDRVVVLPVGRKVDDRFAGRIGKILTQDKVWGNQYWVEFEIKKPDGSLLYDIRTMQPAHEQKSIHKDYLLKIKE